MSESRLRNHYTEYVKHMIRFYITCPESLTVEGHTKADVNNWIAVQQVLCNLEPEEQRFITDVYRRKGNKFDEVVKLCCGLHGMEENDGWKLLALASSRIARVRGLI